MASTITEKSLTYQSGKRIKVVVPAGETSPPIFCALETVVVARPGVGGVLSIEASWSQTDDVTSGTAEWFSWDAGAVSTKTMGTLFKATAVRFTAATSQGIGEVAL